MAELDDVLAKLAEERASYPAFVEAVDADLKVERLRRLAVRQGTIMNLVAQAFALGGSKRKIMRAYNTKDFATIQRILDSMQAQIEEMRSGIEEQAEATVIDWFEIVNAEFVYIDQVGFEVIDLMDGDLILNQVEGDSTRWDGLVLSDKTADAEQATLYRALTDWKSNTHD